jgi:hypothetical protein
MVHAARGSDRHWLLALANATALLVHQIDAAYWHEWEMFRIPGGNQVNLALNLPIVALVLYAVVRAADGTPAALRWALLIAGLGFLTVLIHLGFFLAGHGQFLQPMSIALLVATAVLSTVQVMHLHRHRGRG